jgi:hypothetical protein
MTDQNISSSNAAAMWRGQRPGAMKTASARKVLSAAHGLRAAQARAAREKRWRLRARHQSGRGP